MLSEDSFLQNSAIVLVYFQYGILAGIGIALLMLMYPWARPEIQVGEQTYIQRQGGSSLGLLVFGAVR